MSSAKLERLIVGGFIGALIGGAIYAGVAITTGWLVPFLAGGIAGTGVGVAARTGDHEEIGLVKKIGAISGSIAMVIGYFFIYQWMFIEGFGYVRQYMSFTTFLGAYIDAIHLIFLGLGVYLGYSVAGSVASFQKKVSTRAEVEKREFVGACGECGAREVILRDAKGKLVCYECWEKITKPLAPPAPERVKRKKEIKKGTPTKTIKERISESIYDTFPKLRRKKGKKER